MRKLRFAVLLPILQVVITAILVQWADRASWVLVDSKRPPGPSAYMDLYVIKATLIWRGVNAPAFPFVGLARFLPTYRIMEFAVADIFYLAGVAVLWYLVGQVLDRLRGPAAPADQGITIGKALLNLFIIAWGILLFLGGLLAIRDAIPPVGIHFIRSDVIIGSTLFLLWSLILLIFSGLKLARGIRRKHVKTDAAL